MTDTIEVGYAARYLARLLVLPGGWLLGIFILVPRATSTGGVWDLLLGVFVLWGLLMGLFFARPLWRLLRGRPFLTLDAAGVTLHSAGTRLAWPDVAEIRLVATAKQGRNKMIVFVPVDAQRALEGVRWPRQWFARDGVRRLGSPVFAPVEGLAMPIDDVVEAARRFTAVKVRHQHRL